MIMRELGRVKQIVEEGCGLDITHFYDDLVFVEHSPFLIKFDAANSRLFHLYFSRDCPEEDRQKLLLKMNTACQANEMSCEHAGTFSFEQTDADEEIKINFYEKVKH